MNRGETLAVLGRSGTGKSVLLPRSLSGSNKLTPARCEFKGGTSQALALIKWGP